MKCLIFYHSTLLGYRTMQWEGEFCDAQEWFERNCDLSRVTYCGVALEASVMQASHEPVRSAVLLPTAK